MKFHKRFVLLSFLFLSMTISSQNKSVDLSLDDLIPGGSTYNKYRVKMPKNLLWWGDKLVYTQGDSLMTAPLNNGEKAKLLITQQELNAQLKDKNIRGLQGITFPFPDSPIIQIENKKVLTLYNFKTKKELLSFNIPPNAENIDFNNESKYLAYTKDNNLYIKLDENQKFAITNETNKGIVSGQSVHRNEFGIYKGTFWSPKGSLLAFYKMDETMVEDYPLVDISAREASLKAIKYPMAGMKSHQVLVGIFNPITKETVFLKTGTPKEKYLTNIAWSPDEKQIYIAEINREQNLCHLNCYDVATGNLISTVFEESHSKYVEPESPVLFLKSDSQQFIWLSKRDGYKHAYLYDTKGKLIKQLTKGNWDIVSIVGFDETGNNLIYVSTEQPPSSTFAHPLEKRVYKINLQNGSHVELSKEVGVHKSVLSNSGKYLYDWYSSQFNPGKVNIVDVKSNKAFTFYEAKNPFKEVALPEISLGSLVADDGTTKLCYRLVKPTNFDPSQKYPTIVYVYGGPHSQMVSNTWMGEVRGWDIYMAQKGYVVFTLDNRGTNHRGLDFENITHRQLGIVETRDQMTGVEYLKSLPYVDSERIGVHGWSFGGFMTLNLMLRHPETFKVGVAGGSVTNWKHYEIMYGERYMDSPTENPEGYAETDMTSKASNLKGRLLLIHGDEDPTVVMQHSLQFLKSSIKSGVHPDFFVYPGQGHNMVGKDRLHLHEHITRYFEDFLK